MLSASLDPRPWFFILTALAAILAIDPGRRKCGLAVADDGAIVHRGIAPTPELMDAVGTLQARFRIERIVLGNRTASPQVRAQLAARWPDQPVSLVAEQDTTLLARRRYFQDHPPRGWRRLLPLSMQVPPEPYDDYAAVVIAERFLKEPGSPGSP